MGRLRRARDAGADRRQVGAWWRGIGFIILVVFSVGGYLLADFILTSEWLRQMLPAQAAEVLARVGGEMWVPVHKSLPFLQLPIHILLRLGMMVFFDILVYTILVFAWAFIKPPSSGLPDDPWASGGRG
jgi:hypothetical protein